LRIEGRVIPSQTALIAFGVNGDMQRQVLAVMLANRERAFSWTDLLLALKGSRLAGVEFVVSDDLRSLNARSARSCAR
jgi:transposase-like protein